MERFYGYLKHSDQLEVILINSMAAGLMENNSPYQRTSFAILKVLYKY